MSIDSASLRNAFGLWTATPKRVAFFFAQISAERSFRLVGQLVWNPPGEIARAALDRLALKQKEDPVPEGVGLVGSGGVCRNRASSYL